MALRVESIIGLWQMVDFRESGFFLGTTGARTPSSRPAGCSAYEMDFGSNPVDLFGRDDRDKDLPFTNSTSLSGQFAQQWKLRKVGEVSNSKLRRHLAHGKSFDCTDVAMGTLGHFIRL